MGILALSNVYRFIKRGLCHLYIDFLERHYKTKKFLLKNSADANLINECGIIPAFLNWFDKNNSTHRAILHADNIIKNTHDSDSGFFFMFVFCQVKKCRPTSL